MKNNESNQIHVIELTAEELQEISGGTTVRTSISGGAGGSSTATTITST